ncbi:MAG: ATP-binding cassette domain-containing protein [Bilophila wadsworthia]
MNGLELQDILLTFPEGGRRRTVLDIPYLKVTSGEHIGIRGASGSGKAPPQRRERACASGQRNRTLGRDRTRRAVRTRTRRWRGQHIGFVFQDFQLFPELEALENVLCPQPSPDGASRKP